MNTMSQPGSNTVNRNISRKRRFTLFLVTALPTRRLTDNPYLDIPRPLGITLSITGPDVREIP